LLDCFSYQPPVFPIPVMSDSIRDQLLQAGFKETQARRSPANKARDKPGDKTKGNGRNESGNAPAGGRQNRAKRDTGGATVAVAQKKVFEKKRLKEKIRCLIEAHKIKEHTGDVAYNYLVGSRARQVFVNAECQKKLSTGDLVITRLNGDTLLIPPIIAEQVLELNPEWAIMRNDARDVSAQDPDYAEYPIPDDLNW